MCLLNRGGGGGGGLKCCLWQDLMPSRCILCYSLSLCDMYCNNVCSLTIFLYICKALRGGGVGGRRVCFQMVKN